jgi:hypothetical protein
MIDPAVEERSDGASTAIGSRIPTSVSPRVDIDQWLTVCATYDIAAGHLVGAPRRLKSAVVHRASTRCTRSSPSLQACP